MSLTYVAIFAVLIGPLALQAVIGWYVMLELVFLFT